MFLNNAYSFDFQLFMGSATLFLMSFFAFTFSTLGGQPSNDQHVVLIIAHNECIPEALRLYPTCPQPSKSLIQIGLSLQI